MSRVIECALALFFLFFREPFLEFYFVYTLIAKPPLNTSAVLFEYVDKAALGHNHHGPQRG